MQESLARYLEIYDARSKHFGALLKRLSYLSSVETIDDDTIVSTLTNAELLECFRYLASPFVSSDDLAVLSDSKLSKSALTDPASARRVFETIMQGVDVRRFPWLEAKRTPTEEECNRAITASAALLATQRIRTMRRGDEREAQEESVATALKEMAFTEVATRRIENQDQAPAHGEFCGESELGERKADLVARLRDGRILAIECKVSNSATNSIKRLNNDAAKKAVTWRREFGVRNVVPCAVLTGVFKLKNLLQAQEEKLTIFWAHDLQTLKDWIAETGRAP